MSSEQKKIRLTTALDAVSLLASLFACGACVENVAPAFPLVFLAMYGMVWVQLMAETLVIPVSFLLYILELRKLKREERSASA